MADFGSDSVPPPQYRGTVSRSLYLTMRDGVRLAVTVVLPRNLPPGTRIPALLSQTRYWRDMELRAPFRWVLSADDLNLDFRRFKPFFTGQGYALVLVDVRGTGASFGTWPHPWPEDSIWDMAEVVDWIVAQPWCNGRVGGYGISYVGTTAELLAVPNHPAVKALIPMFNHPDPYTDIAFPGGVFNERFMRMWSHFNKLLDRNCIPPEIGLAARLLVKGVKPVEGDEGRRALAEAIEAHTLNGDVYGLAQMVTCRDERHPVLGIAVDDMAVHRFKDQIKRADVALFGWGSWLDAGTADAVLRRFSTFDNAQRAVIGAWEHGGRFHASPYRSAKRRADPRLPAQWGEMLRFFDAYLKDADNGVRSERVLFYYTLGEEVWKQTDVWPPRGTTTWRWYLAESRALSLDRPAVEAGADPYTVDFTATTGEYNRWWEMGAILNHTVVYPDRARADDRLLTYTSPPLAGDIEINGYPVVTLYVTSTMPDGVFYAYLEDVDERGRVTYITEGQLRAIHRKVSDRPPPYKLQVPYHSFKERDAMPLVPGEIAEITFGLLPTSVLVRKGHCLRLAIAGHDDGTFVRIPAQGTPVITVARNSRHASCLDLPVIRRG